MVSPTLTNRKTAVVENPSAIIKSNEIVHNSKMSSMPRYTIPGVGKYSITSMNRSARLRGDSEVYTSDHGDGAESIKGPIQAQLAAHYSWHGIILILSTLSKFSNLYYPALPTYIFVSYITWQLSRLVYKANPMSILPLYFSFYPYALFHSFTGNAHTVLCGLWYASIMGITLQISRPKLEYHLGGITICFIVIYLVETFVIFPSLSTPTFYLSALGVNPINPNSAIDCLEKSESICTCPYLYIPNMDKSKCDWLISIPVFYEQEVTFIVSILLICASSFMLHRHVCEYAYRLIDRRRAVSNLMTQNADLKKLLAQMHVKDNLDLDSPITKVIKVIRDIQFKGDLEADVMESLDYVISLLSSNQLFLPNLNVNKDAMDTDVNKWLNAMIHQNEAPKLTTDLKSNNLMTNNYASMLSLTHSRLIFLGTRDPSIVEVLENIDTWEFDIFELARVTKGRPLYHLGMALFEIYNFQATFNVGESVMREFLSKVEANYQANTYHNSTHAADVMHSLHYFLTVLGLNELVTSEDAFASIIAAAMHDVDHPGYNNAFMIATSSQAAIRYNDISVLEHYHTARGFDIMLNEPGCNVLAGVSPEKYKTLRASIISMILATDMTAHFEYIAKFKNKVNGAGLELTDPKDRQLCMDIAIKCSDINNAAKSLPLCTKWAENIMEEFFKQGDEERKRGLPISMFMDRQTTVISKCQVGFIDYIVLPLYEVWDQYMNEDGKFPAVSNLQSNRDYWKKLHEDVPAIITS
ncbi:hypothetical protein MT418_002724 [Batrachochytrium dendrobatidis]